MLQTASLDGTHNNIDHKVRGADTGEIVAARLRRSGYPFLWGVTCIFHDGTVILSGTVPTYYLKQVAQELALHTPGVVRVVNRLQVVGAPSAANRTAEGTATPTAAGRRDALNSTPPGSSQPLGHPMSLPPARETLASNAGARRREVTP